MGKIILGLIAIFIVLGTMAAFDFRNRMGNSRLGSDVTYTIDEQGTASVEVVNKSFFVDSTTADNFDKMAVRTGRPDADAYRKSIEESTSSLVERTGRQMFVADFVASYVRTAEYGAQVYHFKWFGFAEQRNSSWVVDFTGANPIKMTKDSSLTVALPPGTSLVKATPSPTAGDGKATLVWTGTGEMPWPYLEYR